MTNRNENEETGKRLKFTKRPLGQVLVEGRFITPEQLNLALEVEKSTNEPVGAILVRMGTLSPADLRATLAAQQALATLECAVKAVAGPKQPLGELLLRAGRITPIQFELAFMEHKRTGERLGEVLVRLGYITRRERDAVLKFQKHQADTSHDSINFRLGEILLRAKKITQDQLKRALENQKLSNKKIGDILVEAGYVEPRHVEWGLGIQEKLLTAALVAVLSLASISEADAAAHGRAEPHESDTTISVTATIMPSSHMHVISQAREITITNSDIGRGYVDSDAATVIEVKNNSSRGYMLIFEGEETIFKEVQVRGPGINAILRNGTGIITRPYAGKGAVRLDLSYRFILSDGIRPGTYAWPLTLSVNPL